MIAILTKISNINFYLLLSCIMAFLIGSIPTGLLLAKIKGIDLRKTGSGNIGATNVLRTMGKNYALITLVCDILKGVIPIILISYLVDNGILNIKDFGNNHLTLSAIKGLAGIFAILGHIFPVFLRFKGGKGVATSIGVILALFPYIGLLVITIWMVVFAKTGYSSLSALISFAILPVIINFMNYSKENFLTSIIIVILIFIRHIPNIKRLVQGKENKFTIKQ